MLTNIPDTDPWIGPFLENPGPRSMTVSWIRRDPAPCTLTVNTPDEPARSYETTPCSRIGDDGDSVYRVRLDGLTPDRAYRYALRCPSGRVESEFRTFPLDPERIVFIYYGDNKSIFDVHRRVATRFARHEPLFVMHSGDMTERGRYEEYRSYLFHPLRDVIDRIPLYPGRGNHEGNGQAFRELFDLPGSQPWYAFDCGPVHGIVLDTTGWRHPPEHKDIPAMRAWLEADLERPRPPWTIAMYHEPSYDLGWRKDDWGREDFLPILRRGGTDLTLSGHAHGYQRLHPMIAPGENDSNPITHIVSAGAGAPIGSKPLDPSPYLAVDARRFNYMVFTAERERLSVQVYSEYDALLDEFELLKPNGQYPPEFIARSMDQTAYPHGATRFTETAIGNQRCPNV